MLENVTEGFTDVMFELRYEWKYRDSKRLNNLFKGWVYVS